MRNHLHVKFITKIVSDERIRLLGYSWESALKKFYTFIIVISLAVAITVSPALSSTIAFNDNWNISEKAINVLSGSAVVSEMRWVLLPQGANGSCVSTTECCENVFCYGLEYTPANSGELTSYTTGFFADCVFGNSPVMSNGSCVGEDNSFLNNGCALYNLVQFISSGTGELAVTSGVPVIIHQVCFSVPPGATVNVLEDEVTDLTTSIDLTGGGSITEYPAYEIISIAGTPPVVPPDGFSSVECLSETFIPDPPTSIIGICGDPIVGILQPAVDSPNPLTCEGTRTYTFVFTDCAGQSSDWNYIFTIEKETFSDPVDAAMTVPYPENTNVAPTNYLPMVVDNCGNNLSPSAPVISDPIICEGERTYTYYYTDCEGNIQDWIFTYSVINSTVVINTNDIGGGSLRHVINCAPAGDTVTFAPALMDQSIVLTSGTIDITKNLILQGLGMGHLILSGNNSSGIFHLLQGKTFGINDITLRDGNSISHGGAMYIEGILSLRNVLFENNYENGVPKGMTITGTSEITISGNVEIRD